MSRATSTFCLRRLIRCLVLAALVGSLATCSSPTDPGVCRDGHDGLGRGPTNLYSFTCAYVGSDTIQCASTHLQAGYCADSTRRDVTATTEWVTSNPAAATFVSPGVLKVTGTGQIEITAKVSFAQVSGDYVYVVSPGATPERLIKVSVIVRDAANTERRLVNAAIVVEPERGPSQSCRSSGTGHCEFWVFDGRILARASLQEYEPAEGFAVRPSPDTFSQHAILDLRAIR